ncbi:transposable element Tcb2 transposase [Trichonephila clavipes]|nr:transposable element Tcb2 transposase [Trichonephila clavipes]
MTVQLPPGSWSTATGVLMSTSAAPCKGALIQDPLTANHRRLHLQCAHEHRAWKTDWHQVVFSDESRFNLWDHEGRIRVGPVNVAFQSALSNEIVA